MFLNLRDNYNYENEYELENELNSLDYDYEDNKNNFYEGANNYIFNYYRPNDDVTSLENGFLRGNMFDNIYDGYYKNIKKIRSTNERERLLLKIQALTFASVDLGLHLDIYPNDKNILDKFTKYNMELEKSTKEYERIYGPLKSECDMDGNNYDWIKGPWPWNGGNK